MSRGGNRLDSNGTRFRISIRAMKTLVLSTACLALCLTAGAFAADDAGGKSHMRDVLKARLAEDAKKKAPQPARSSPSTAQGATTEKAAPPAETPTPPVLALNTPIPTSTAGSAKNSPSKDEPATVLPQVEVRKSRITELDRQLYEQEKEIAREKKNTQPTELDKALNDSKVAKSFSIFGGESNQYRANVAKERVSLMEEEKVLLEAIARARTKDEKQDLQKQVDEIRTMRRQLEKSLK
jgi:hypothetical protein